MTKQNDQAQIRDVIEDWAAGLRSKDAVRVKSHEVEELLHFSLAPPLVADENGSYSLDNWFKTWDGPLGYEVRDLEVVSGASVAFSHSLNHVTGTQRGKKADVWFRSTLGFRKIDGEWKIVHEHESVPFLMDGSGKAAVDLKP